MADTNLTDLDKTIFVNDDNANLYTGVEDDAITVTGNENRIFTDGGDDTVHVSGAGNVVYTDYGNDSIVSTGDDNMLGGADGDELNDVATPSSPHHRLTYAHARITFRPSDSERQRR